MNAVHPTPDRSYFLKRPSETFNQPGYQQSLSEAEAADFLGISVSSLRKSRMNGPRANHLPPPPYVKLGRRVIYRSADLMRFLEDHLAVTPAGAAS